MSDKPKTKSEADPNEIPALFATIHFRSDERPNGYSDEDIAELNEALNAKAGDAK